MPGAESLAHLPLLANLDADEFLAVSSRFEREQFPAGQKILVEGYIGLKIYVLVDGRVKVYRSMGSSQLLINTLGPTEAFGEISLIDGGPASATVEAETDVATLGLSKDAFYELVEGSPTLGRKLYRNLLEIFSQRIRSTTNQVQDYFAINQALCDNENFRRFYKILCL